MSATARALTLLLPERARLAGDLAAQPRLADWLGRGDCACAEAGENAQFARYFDIVPRGLPVAALTRQRDCRDAAHSQWLRADPAHVRADLGTGRLLASGELGLDAQETEALLRALKPMFGDEGFLISAGTPSRWYLMLPRDACLPDFTPPQAALGDDLFAHLPQGEAGRRWRRLLSEAQVLLHNHPVNAARVQRGLPTVNSLWFWGGGALPDVVRAPWLSCVVTDEPVLAALAESAAPSLQPIAKMSADLLDAGVLIDLRALRTLDEFDARWVEPIESALGLRKFDRVRLDFEDGLQLDWRAANRWRFWRPPAKALV